MEPAHGHLDALFTQAPAYIYRARELICLNSDQADDALISRLDIGDDLLDRDNRVGLVIGIDNDVDIRT